MSDVAAREAMAYEMMYAIADAKKALERCRQAAAAYHAGTTGPTYLTVLDALTHIDRARVSVAALKLTPREDRSTSNR